MTDLIPLNLKPLELVVPKSYGRCVRGRYQGAPSVSPDNALEAMGPVLESVLGSLTQVRAPSLPKPRVGRMLRYKPPKQHEESLLAQRLLHCLHRRLLQAACKQGLHRHYMVWPLDLCRHAEAATSRCMQNTLR